MLNRIGNLAKRYELRVYHRRRIPIKRLGCGGGGGGGKGCVVLLFLSVYLARTLSTHSMRLPSISAKFAASTCMARYARWGPTVMMVGSGSFAAFSEPPSPPFWIDIHLASPNDPRGRTVSLWNSPYAARIWVNHVMQHSSPLVDVSNALWSGRHSHASILENFEELHCSGRVAVRGLLLQCIWIRRRHWGVPWRHTLSPPEIIVGKGLRLFLDIGL